MKNKKTMNLSSFPLTLELISQLVRGSRDYTDVVDRTFYYIACLNEGRQRSLITKVYSSLTHTGTALGFLKLDGWGYAIEICNPQQQTISEQCFTICHEIGHLYISYELYKQEACSSLQFNYPDNLESLCDEIATILMHQKDLP